MRKHWFFVALLIGVLVIGATAGAVMANGDSTSTDSPLKSFASRVAKTLGVDEAKVEDAMKQASREMEDEAIQKKLDNMVAQGVITKEQAEQYKQWYQARPEGVSPGFPFAKRGGFGGMMGGGRGGHGMGFKRGVPATPGTPAPTTN